MLNFDQGLSIKLATQLVKGAVLTLSLDSRNGELKEELEKLGLSAISIEVRWTIEESRGSFTVRFRYVSTEQARVIVEKLLKFSSRASVSGDVGEVSDVGIKYRVSNHSRKKLTYSIYLIVLMIISSSLMACPAVFSENIFLIAANIDSHGIIYLFLQ